MMMDSKLLVGAAALCAAISLNAEAKLYKWVDNNGQTHYGETIPPEYANSDTKILDKNRIKDRDDGFDAGKKNAAKKETESDKAALEARRRDEALLNSYSNEKEIDLARDRNLLQIEARVNSYTTMLKSAKSALVELHAEADALTQKGRKIPQSLSDDLKSGEELVTRRQQELDTSQKELEAVKARYENDKQRYRTLKGQSPAAK
jgi:uncharacterized protein involved in exopolysaccharide biosynthesis